MKRIAIFLSVIALLCACMTGCAPTSSSSVEQSSESILLFSKLKDVTSGRLFYDDFDSL